MLGFEERVSGIMWIRMFGVFLFAFFKAQSLVSASPETCVNGVLDVTNRGLTAIPDYDPAACGIGGPQAVYAPGNNIGVLRRGSFAEYPHLQLLNLSCSNLTRIEDGAFEGAVALTDMDISGNSQRRSALVGKPFRGTSLEVLLMRQCNLRLIGDEVFVVNFSRLQRLDLSGNRLGCISQMLLGNLTGLHNLNLSYNRIELIHPGAFAMSLELTFLHLGNNRLRMIPAGLFKGLLNLDRLVLVGNPYLKGPILVPAGVVVEPSYLLDMGTTTAAPPLELVTGGRPIITGPPAASRNDDMGQDEGGVTGSSGNTATVIAVMGAIFIIFSVAFVVVLKRKDIRKWYNQSNHPHVDYSGPV